MDRPRVTPENLRQALHSEIRRRSSGVEWTRWLDAAVALRNYSFRNVVLITLQMPYASQVARSDIWQKFGRSVMDNQKNRDIRILAPVIRNGNRVAVQAESAELELERGRPARGGGRLIGFRVGSVWDISQTDGPAMLAPAGPAGEAATSDLWRALAHEVHSAGYTLVQGNTGNHSVDGFTNYRTRTVVIRDGLDDVTAVACLAHEVAHLRMHHHREIDPAGSVTCRGIREIEAESVAYILLAHHGLSTGGSSFRYVASWAAAVNKREPEKVIERTGNRVVAVARRLVQSVDRNLRRTGVSRAHRPTLGSPVVERSALRQDGIGCSFGSPEW